MPSFSSAALRLALQACSIGTRFLLVLYITCIHTYIPDVDRCVAALGKPLAYFAGAMWSTPSGALWGWFLTVAGKHCSAERIPA